MQELKISSTEFVSEGQGRLRDMYRIGKKLGEGLYGNVKKITHRKRGDIRVVKTIRKKNLRTEEEKQIFFNEISALRSLDHPNIIHIYEYYQDEKNYYLITEYCSGEGLSDRIINIGSFSESEAAGYMREILSVVVYCHERGFAHRNLNLEHFLFDDHSEGSNLKVIDFSSAQSLSQQPFTQKVGAAYYMAPEVIRENYTESCDVWSAGVILYILLCGYPPFYGKTDEEILEQVNLGYYEFPSPEWDFISYDAKDLIQQMLCYNLEDRITAKEALKHVWFSNAKPLPLPHSIVQNIFKSMENFRGNEKLQKATLSFVASQILTKQERGEMINIFKSLDTDSSGTLSKQNLIEGYNLLIGKSGCKFEVDIDRIMENIDLDKSGVIEYSEFVVATMNKKKLLNKEKLICVFNAFDVDSNGTITCDNVKSMLGKYQHYDDTVWEEIIREVDANGDGVIDLKEFIDMMTASYIYS